MKLIFIVNAGSSSVKFQIMNQEDLSVIASGLLERIYIDGQYTIEFKGQKFTDKVDLPNHETAISFLVEKLQKIGIVKDLNDIVGIGHRVVHGGIEYRQPTLVNEAFLEDLETLIPLAPLHNPGAIAGMRGFQKAAPKAINVAHFDTAFHATIPEENFRYAVPEYWLTKHHVRRYGFHGISYNYITQKAAKTLSKVKPNLIIAHLGNGASICAVKEGKSFNTSMGFTPLAGLIMGTRSGDVAPGIFEYISKVANLDVEAISNALNKESGLKGLANHADMRQIEANALENVPEAKLACKMWAKRIATYIVDYYNQLNGQLDAIIFTAGIGENSSFAREMILKSLPIMPIDFDPKENRAKYQDSLALHTTKSDIKIYAMRTNEELLIAQAVLKFF